MSLHDTEIPSLDLRATLNGVVRRWKIVGLSIVVTIGIVFAQDSGLRTEPNGEVVVERTYEAVVEIDELAMVKVDPSAIVPIPSFDNQLAVLKSDETIDEIQTKIGAEGSLDVSRSEPKFTITESVDDVNNQVSFLSTGTPSYSYRCVAADEESCNLLLDAYVAKTSELRKASVLGGLEGGLQLMTSLITAGQERLSDGSLDNAQQDAQRVELAALITKRDALKIAAEKVSGAMILVGQDSFVQGRTTASVTASTYGFGLGVGLIIGLLIALQLAALDKRLRYSWQIHRVNALIPIIGSPRARADAAQSIAVAAAIDHAHQQGLSSMFIYAPDSTLVDFARGVFARVPQTSGTILESIEVASVEQLSGRQSGGVIVLVKAGQMTRQELSESIGLLTAGGHQLVGVALIA